MLILKEKIQIIYAFLTLVLCAAFSYLAIHCYYSDSEIWLLTLSQKVFAPQDFIAVYNKWFFHLITYLSAVGTNKSLLVYDLARIAYTLIALSSAVLIAHIFSQIYNNKRLFFPLIIITLSSSLFFNQGFRIRADILALFLHLLFLYVTCFTQNKKWQNIYTLLFLQTLLLLTTPKAVIFIFLHMSLGIFLINQQAEQKKVGKSILASIAIPVCFGLLVLSILGFVVQRHPLLLSLHGAINFYIKSYDQGLGGAEFFSFFDFMYLFRFFKNSPVHTLFFFFWLIIFFKDIFKKKNENTLIYFFKIYTALLIIFVFLYNQKLPFFLAPFLAPVIANQFCIFYTFLEKKRLTMLTPALLLMAVLISFRQLTVNLRFNNNDAQRAFITELDTYKKENPQITVYDIIGLLPKNTNYYLFIGPGDISQREQILSQIKFNLPDIYLFTFKNVFLGNEIGQLLKEFYFEYSPGVWLKSQNINLQKETHAMKDIFRNEKKNYWLTRTDKITKVYSRKDKKEITNLCLFLNSEKKVSQTEIKYVAIPFSYIDVTILQAPLTNFSMNPQALFMFDTAF